VLPNLQQRFFSAEHPELMDLPNLDPGALARDLQNLETINRHFGGRQATSFILRKAAIGQKKNSTVLDCACGAGDLTAQLFHSLPGSHLSAVDLQPQTLAYAREKYGSQNINWQQADLKQLPFQDQTFDLVTCQLALHHFSDTDAVQVLSELKRVSRGLVFVTDLTRSALGYLGVWLLVHTWLRDPMTRHDALLSVRRAYTRAELESLARQASWENFQSCGLPWFRQALWMD